MDERSTHRPSRRDALRKKRVKITLALNVDERFFPGDCKHCPIARKEYMPTGPIDGYDAFSCPVGYTGLTCPAEEVPYPTRTESCSNIERGNG